MEPNQIRVYLESGKTRVIATAVDWPGWCRTGHSESDALERLFEYSFRYGRVMEGALLNFQPPASVEKFVVFERLPGKGAADYGVPEAVLESDRLPAGPKEMERWRNILTACWGAFDRAIQAGEGRNLRKGPRGGGRDLEKIITHVREAEGGYVSVLGGRLQPMYESEKVRREAVLAVLTAAERGEFPAFGPRGGKRWPPRYFVRRFAWHVLDHVWEIEDRIE